MISVASIVIIACALALGAQGQNACSPADIGSKFGHPVQLEELILQPYVRDWTITVHKIPLCFKGVSGVHADVCDGDFPPQISFYNASILLVHRLGSLFTPVRVTATVYCDF